MRSGVDTLEPFSRKLRTRLEPETLELFWGEVCCGDALELVVCVRVRHRSEGLIRLPDDSAVNVDASDRLAGVELDHADHRAFRGADLLQLRDGEQLATEFGNAVMDADEMFHVKPFLVSGGLFRRGKFGRIR